jgi:ubiquinone/menaquinone biosynthesis C-methylase UbiE
MPPTSSKVSRARQVSTHERTAALNRPRGEAVSARPRYLLENTGEEAADRFAALSELFDQTTTRRLEQCGVGPGWRCLEVGAGGGSIATWIADRVGSSGAVLATDIEPRFLTALARPNLEVRRHDIAVDALPEGAFDLVHARLVLMHQPDREQALTRMIDALKPGGWILAEEFDSVSMPAAPNLCPAETLLMTQIALLQLLEDHGVNRLYGRLLYGVLRSHGLVDVDAEGRVIMLRHGSPGESMLRANYLQLRSAMVEGGYIGRDQFEADLKRLQDPDFAMPSAALWSALGRRPHEIGGE